MMHYCLGLALLLSTSALAGQSPFEATTGGTRLAFTVGELPAGNWFEIAVPLDQARRLRAAAILAREAKKYPPGFLGAIGITAIGVFDGLATRKNDGFHTWDARLGGYRYFGLWNGQDAIMAAYYTDEQLPLTFHHEVYHHIDATKRGRTSYRTFEDDDARFRSAVDASVAYPVAPIGRESLAALRAVASGAPLHDSVGAYTKKSNGEDQAETARWFMTNLADGLVQSATRPDWRGSQRVLHLLSEYASAAPAGAAQADLAWFVDVALGRPSRPRHQSAPPRPAGSTESLRPQSALDGHLRPDGQFVVRGVENIIGINVTLQRDIRTTLTLAEGAGEGCTATRRHADALLAEYQNFIESRWSLSEATASVFRDVRRRLLAPCSIERSGTVPARNPWSGRVEQAIADPRLRTAILGVQPAAVRLSIAGSGGSGVIVDGAGLVLTAAHVADAIGARLQAELPDGRTFTATCIAIDAHLDLAVLRLSMPRGTLLPVAAIAPAAPEAGDVVVAIGQPGGHTPGGGPTGYQPFHVSVGRIRGFKGARLASQALGGTKHDAWTYWGHSGCPLFDANGQIVAMHNSWDSTTAMRHAVTWEAITDFLGRVL